MKIFLLIVILSGGLPLSYGLEKISVITENYGPYNFRQIGRIQGIGVDILEKVFQELKQKITRKDITLKNWNEGYQLVQNPGKKNMFFSMARTTEREKLFTWVGPFWRVKLALFGRAGTNKNLALSKIRALGPVGVVNRDRGKDAILDIGFKESDLRKSPNPEALFYKFHKGKIDMFVYPEAATYYIFRAMGYSSKKLVVLRELKNVNLYYAFNKSVNKSTTDAYQRALKKVLANKSFMEKTRNQYFPVVEGKL